MADLVDPNALVPGRNYTYAQWIASQNMRNAAMQNMPTLPTIQMPAPATGVQNSAQAKFLNIEATTGATAGASLILGGGGYFGTAANTVENYTINVKQFDKATITESGFTTLADAVMLSQAITNNPMLIKRITVSGATTAIQQSAQMALKTTKRNAQWNIGAPATIDLFTPQLQQSQFQSSVVVYEWQNGVLVDGTTYLKLDFDVSLSLVLLVEYSNIVDFASPASVMAYADAAKLTKQYVGTGCNY